jgi:hypothetical protein
MNMQATSKNIRDDEIYITFDVDWACDEVLSHTIDLVEINNLHATFFITHDTPLLARLRGNPRIELGIHPNFNALLAGNKTASALEILRDIKTIVPEAVSVRAHALTTGSLFSDMFYQENLQIESNAYYYPSANHLIPLPTYDPCGILRVYHFWEDDCHCAWIERGIEKDWGAQRFLEYSGMKIFDFHPIHLFLNTERSARYESTRSFHKKPTHLKQYCNEDGDGTATFFRDLVSQIRANNLLTKPLRDILT